LAVAQMEDCTGEKVGVVHFTSGEDHVLVQARFTGLALQNGFYGFHLHAVGECDPDHPDGPFMSAGDHYNPAGESHPAHDGDLPSLLVVHDGAAQLQVKTARFTVEDLMEGDGTALIVHTQRDNFSHIPDRYQSTESDQPGPDQRTLATGDAGDREACGAVQWLLAADSTAKAQPSAE
jgi:superoxide dismutase, Cu-Zn family